jgi:transcriptional regulator with XRE-family HTH domain
MKINKNILELRLKHDLSKQEFCEIVGVNRRTLDRWESGERLPDLQSTRAIVDKFYVTDVYEFIFGKRYENKRALTKIKKNAKQNLCRL